MAEGAPSSEKRKPFDPVAYTESARRSYVKIGEELKAQGVDIDNLPKEVFAPANKTIETLYNLSKSHASETDPKKKRNIKNRMRRAKSNLEDSVVAGIEEKVQGLRTTEQFRELEAKHMKGNEISSETAPTPVSETASGRAEEIRQRLKTLEREAANPADYHRAHDELENEALTLESELRGLESGTQPVEKKPSVATDKPELRRAAKVVQEEKIAPVSEPAEEEWSPSPLEEQRSAVLGELYALYRRNVNGPMEFDAIPSDVYQKFEEFFDEHSKNLLPTDTIPEADIDSFLAEQGVMERADKIETSIQETTPATGSEEKLIGKKSKASSLNVETEVRDDGLEYVSITPQAFEGTPLELRKKLGELIKKLVG